MSFSSLHRAIPLAEALFMYLLGTRGHTKAWAWVHFSGAAQYTCNPLLVLLMRAAELKPCSVLKKFCLNDYWHKPLSGAWLYTKKNLVRNMRSYCRLMHMSNTFVRNCTSAHLLKKEFCTKYNTNEPNFLVVNYTACTKKRPTVLPLFFYLNNYASLGSQGPHRWTFQMPSTISEQISIFFYILQRR